MGSYRLKCVEGGEYVDDDLRLRCDHHNGLLRAEYIATQLELKRTKSVFKFFDWLPVSSTIDSAAAPVVFKNDRLNKELGLEDLWIAFTGYYPERNAFVRSCSFKELEALPTIARMNEFKKRTIVVASAGNTGRAFAQVSNETGTRSVIVVPERSSERIWVHENKGHSKLISVKGDYADSIAVADRLSKLNGYVPEGGARNIARRDGMGTVMLEAALTMKRIPELYFQAVGSGTGAISVWEASMRLIKDGRFGNRLPELHLSQNSPFIPMKKAWDERRRDIIEDDLKDADPTKVYADVLTNRYPPYSLAGGLFDALTECGGVINSVTNSEAKEAEKIWMQFEHAIPDPAASVALASLIRSMNGNKIKKDRTILLNMTGGGYNLIPRTEMRTIGVYATVEKDATDEELRRTLLE